MNAYDLKQSIPNKVVQDDGTVTDIFGKAIASQEIGYRSRRSLPNKWLQPDDTYVTLQEIIAGAIDTDIFIIVNELPETGEANKIYLVPNDETGGFVEYIYVDNKWDPIGMISIDLSNYWTIEQVQQAITVALNQAKAYADELFANSPPEVIYYDGGKTNYTFWNNLITKTNPVLVYMFGNSYAAYIPNPSAIPDTATSRKVEFITPKLYTRDSGGYTYISQQMWTYNLVFENGEVVAIGTSYEQIMLNTIDPTKTYGSAFNPTKPYHPATKKYVDDAIANSVTDALGGEY